LPDGRLALATNPSLALYDGMPDPPAAVVTVVVADNDPTVLDLLRTDLTLEGYHVVATAAGGDAAVAACLEHRPDVLIVDYRMPPGPNGLETIAKVRAAGTAEVTILYTNYRSSVLDDLARRQHAVLVSKGPLTTLRHALRRLTS
jgi:CheY-like chemotaxis protein